MIHKTYTAYKDCEYLVNASWKVCAVFNLYLNITQTYNPWLTSSLLLYKLDQWHSIYNSFQAHTRHCVKPTSFTTLSQSCHITVTLMLYVNCARAIIHNLYKLYKLFIYIMSHNCHKLVTINPWLLSFIVS